MTVSAGPVYAESEHAVTIPVLEAQALSIEACSATAVDRATNFLVVPWVSSVPSRRWHRRHTIRTTSDNKPGCGPHDGACASSGNLLGKSVTRGRCACGDHASGRRTSPANGGASCPRSTIVLPTWTTRTGLAQRPQNVSISHLARLVLRDLLFRISTGPAT